MSFNLKIIFVIVLGLLVLFSAFFSATETAYSSVSRSKIETHKRKGKRVAILIQKQYQRFGWTLATILILNNLVNVGASALTTYLLSEILGSSGATTLIATVVVTPIIVILGEIIPKLLAKKYAYGYLSKVAYIMRIFNYLFFPVTYPLSKMALSSSITNTENELKTMLDIASLEGVLEKREATLAQNALDLDSKVVSSMMISAKQIKALSHNATILEAKKFFRQTGHSRLAVKKDQQFIGIIFLKDIFLANKGTIESYVIRPPFISKNTIAIKALEHLRKNKAHLAFVTQSQSKLKVIGLITIEDIIEELVGEIYDEHDLSSPIRPIGLHKFVAQGSALMRDLNFLIDYQFVKPDDMITIQQWIQKRIKRRIKKGLVYYFDSKIRFKILVNKNHQETIIEITHK